VDLIYSQCQEYMLAIRYALKYRPLIKNRIKVCDCVMDTSARERRATLDLIFDAPTNVETTIRSDTKHRQKRKTQGVYTCWEINTSNTAWSDTVPCCVPCGRFKAEKALISLIAIQFEPTSV
jgi:hypothetical protein